MSEIEVASEIKVGDVVMLNSGGPLMTVGEEEGIGLHRCYWFGDADQFFDLRSEVFPLQAVHLADDEDDEDDED